MKYKTNSLSTQLRIDFRRSYFYLILLALLLPLLGQAQWSSVGSPGFSAGDATYHSLVFNSSTPAGNGSQGFSGDGGAANSAQLDGPASVAVDVLGNVYFSDYGNQRIRKIGTATLSTSTLTLGTGSNPTTCTGTEGSIAFTSSGYSSTTQTLSYTKNSTATTASVNVGSDGSFTLTGLGAGTYTDFAIGGTTASGSRELTNPTAPTFTVGTLTHPTTYTGTNGSIPLTGLANSTAYSLSYKKNGGAAVVSAITSSGSGTYTITGLGVGAYTEIKVTLNNCVSSTATATLNSPTPVINTIAGTGVGGSSGTGGQAINAQLRNDANGVAVDAAGNVYIPEFYNNWVRRVATDGVIYVHAGRIDGMGYSGDNGGATSATLNSPRGVAVDAAGNVYIADSFNHRLRKVTNGNISTIAGTGTGGTSGNGGLATAAQLNYPYDVAIDAAGNFYISDYYNHLVRKIGTDGKINLFAGTGTAGFSGDAGAATSAQLNNPCGLATDAAGNVYIADFNNHRVRKVATDGTISTFAGSSSVGGYGGDYGLATAAQLNNPIDMVVDASGNVYISDFANNRIRKVGADGNIMTYAGTGTGGFSGDGGAANAAQLYGPEGLAVDIAGNLYINDNFNKRVRKVGTNAPSTLTLGTGSNPTTCSGTEGSIAFTSSGYASTTQTLSYTKNSTAATASVNVSSDGSFTLTGLGAGTYTGFAIGSTTASGSRELTDPAVPTFTVGTLTHPTTCSGTNGIIPLTGLANSTSYSLSYKKNGGAAVVATIASSNTGTYTISGLGAGDYTEIKVTLNGCTSTNKTATLTNPNYTLVAGTMNPPATCGGAGSINFTTTLPTGTYTLNYKKDGTPQTSSFTIGGDDSRLSAELASGFVLSNIGAGTYTDFSVTHLGCNASTAGPVVLNDPTAPTFTVGTQTNPIGCGTSDGSIPLTGLANSTSYSLSYKKNGGVAVVATITSSNTGTYTISGLGAGTYTEIKVTLNGCTSTNKTATLTDPTYTLVAGTVNPPATCGGAGSINFTTTLPSGTYTLNYKKDGTPQTSSFTIGGDDFRLSAELASGFLFSNVGPGVYSDFSVSYGGCTIVGTGGSKTLAAPNSPAVFSVTGGGAYCAGGPGVLVGLSGSEVGVIYYFKNIESDGKAGTGSAISFGNQKAAGIYTVEAVNTTSNCKSMMTGSATVTVNTGAASGGLIVYNGSPFCANAGTANVTRTAAEGGTYSCETPGLSLNSSTGAVNLAASTPGTYLVRYTLASTCTYVNTTAYITVTAAPTATIAYSNSSYCKGSGTANVTLTGKTGGVFSSTSGLSINANTGAIDLAASTAGTYLVTYTIAAANGCAELKTTANVNITTAPTATIAYANSPYCSNAGQASVTLTGSQGGVFSSTSGLSINTNTGAINLSASTSGTYVVTYTIAAANGCSEFKTTASVTITAAPTATIAYSSTPYCANAGTATVTLTGKTGGVFSSTTGLSIDANTGAINLANSAAGTYVVTYTLAAANGCGEFKTTANVSITTTPTAKIAYANTPYCSNAGTASVTLTGSQGGTFSSTAGLSVNVNTGEINLSASTAGTYVVTYTIAAANGCSEFKTTASVTITTAPTATIAYSSTPYCANAGTATVVTQTGKTGGVFSSTSGLSIDANTGVINLSASTAGNYVVTYTIPAANGCGEFKTTANVSITTKPLATIAYSGTPYCSNAGVASVTLTGSQGGTFSSTTGLSINVATGAIDLAASTVGTYAVTYTIAAANGCAEFKTTTNVSITAVPTATIAYSSTPYCANAGTATVTLTGKTGGVFSSASGLSIDANTGAINLATSTAGSYVVTYTIAAANGCEEFKTTTNVAITTTPAATIAYSGTPYCANAGTALVTLTGSQGGMFSSTSGLSIDVATGEINLSASTAGSYVVTYTIAAANGCSEFKTTASVSITTAPTATIAYSNSPYCASAGTATVTLTGKTGGVFGSTSGLSINSNTGTIDLAASTAGSYVVTYTIAAVNGCGELKATANVTIQAVLVTPSILSNQSSSVCMGTEVLLYTNCPQGSTVLWSNNSTATVLALNANTPSSQILTAKCQQAGACVSAPSEPYKVEWLSTFSLTPINIGQSKSGLKPENSPKSAWSSQYILPDSGPALENSNESNPTIYYSENMNKTAPRYWTIHVETCNLGTAGSLTFNMLSKDESGVERSYNTHENNAPYLMYANRNGFTELYAQNHPAYGFYQDNGSGGNVYDTGLPKGLYKLGIRYWDQKGWGSIFPATRQPAGNVLAYQEFWFRIQSKDGVGKGAARVAADNGQLVTDNGLFAEVMPNPVSSILRLKVTDVKDQKVSVSLIDASGRMLLQRAFTPETNQYQEEFEVSELANGMYFLKVNAGEKQATLKVVKVQ